MFLILQQLCRKCSVRQASNPYRCSHRQYYCWSDPLTLHDAPPHIPCICCKAGRPGHNDLPTLACQSQTCWQMLASRGTRAAVKQWWACAQQGVTKDLPFLPRGVVKIFRCSSWWSKKALQLHMMPTQSHKARRCTRMWKMFFNLLPQALHSKPYMSAASMKEKKLKETLILGSASDKPVLLGISCGVPVV